MKAKNILNIQNACTAKKNQSSQAIDHHANEHTDEPAFQCHHFHICFFSKEFWRIDNYKTHPEKDDDKNFAHCHLCLDEVRHANMIKHQATEHPDQIAYQCV